MLMLTYNYHVIVPEHKNYCVNSNGTSITQNFVEDTLYFSVYQNKYQNQKMKLLCFLATFITALTIAQTDSNFKNTEEPAIEINQHLIGSQKNQGQSSDQQIDQTRLEEVEEAALQQQTKGNLNEWVISQLQQAQKLRGLNLGQSFIIHLNPQQSFEYKWDLAVPTSKKRNYTLFLNIFNHQDGSDITLNKNPEKQSYVEVESKSKVQESYHKLGDFYISKAFTVNFLEDSKFIRLTNFNPIDVLIEINMEMELKQIEGISQAIATNKHFALSAQKLNTIYEELKNTDKSRSRMYKWQWGFLQKEERYDDEMLKLTGVQLVVILATAVVQMYCIKSLLENKQII